MRLAHLGGPFEQAAAAAAATTIDRIEGTTLAASPVILDGTLPPQKPLMSRVWLGPLILVGVVGAFVYFGRKRNT